MLCHAGFALIKWASSESFASSTLTASVTTLAPAYKRTDVGTRMTLKIQISNFLTVLHGIVNFKRRILIYNGRGWSCDVTRYAKNSCANTWLNIGLEDGESTKKKLKTGEEIFNQERKRAKTIRQALISDYDPLWNIPFLMRHLFVSCGASRV